MENIEWSGILWLFAFITAVFVLLLIKVNSSRQRSYPKPTQFSDEQYSTNSNLKSRVRGASSLIKIRARGNNFNQQTDPNDFKRIIEKSRFIHFDIRELWEKTKLQTVYFTADFCIDLRTYLSKYTNSHGLITLEIGGILLGNYSNSLNDSFQVIVSHFIPIESQIEHNLHLQFDTQSLAKRLGDAHDLLPDKVVLGWFHTHPGHGLFLSKPDLSIQKGFFTQEYHFAMEIDSMTDEYDLGFFTYFEKGQMNNTSIRKRWFSWKAIEKKLDM